MRHRPRLIFLVAALVIGLCTQAPAALAAGSSASGVVEAFSKAYFMLDESMADYMSRDALTNENDVDLVALYLKLKSDEAAGRGYDISYLRMKPILLKATVVAEDEHSATVEVDATLIRSINPLFRIVGWLFGLVAEHEVKELVTAVKEDGQWKVGPGAFDLPR